MHAGSIPARASNNFNGLCGESAPFPLCAALRVPHGYPRGATSHYARRPDWPRDTAVMARAKRRTQAHSNEAQAVRCVGTGPFVLGGLRLGPMRPMPLPWGVPNLPLPGRRSRSSTAPATTTTTTEPALDGAPGDAPRHAPPMSALPPKPDIRDRRIRTGVVFDRHVCYAIGDRKWSSGDSRLKGFCEDADARNRHRFGLVVSVR